MFPAKHGPDKIRRVEWPTLRTARAPGSLCSDKRSLHGACTRPLCIGARCAYAAAPADSSTPARCNIFMPDGSSTAHTYRPKLLTVVGEGYGVEAFRRDALAALTVAIVALPLSMAIA